MGLAEAATANAAEAVRREYFDLFIGVGRGGSALAPALAGFLFAAGYGLQTVAILMGLGSIVGAIALFAMRGWSAPNETVATDND